jgi:hypothetical protein
VGVGTGCPFPSLEFHRTFRQSSPSAMFRRCWCVVIGTAVATVTTAYITAASTADAVAVRTASRRPGVGRPWVGQVSSAAIGVVNRHCGLLGHRHLGLGWAVRRRSGFGCRRRRRPSAFRGFVVKRCRFAVRRCRCLRRRFTVRQMRLGWMKFLECSGSARRGAAQLG